MAKYHGESEIGEIVGGIIGGIKHDDEDEEDEDDE